LVNKLISDKLGLTEFSEIRKFALQVCHAIPNVRFNKCYYLLGVTRLVIDEKLRGRHIGELNKILLNIENRGDKLSRDLDGMSFIDLWEEYYEDEMVAQAETVQKIRTTPTGYVIKHIETFDESYNSGPQDWCITYEEEYFYSLVDAEDCIYIVENPNMMKSIDKNSEEWKWAVRIMGDPRFDDLGEYGSGEPPYDTFGLSRFVVTVNPSDVMVYSRWNIPDGLDGNFLNKQELEEVLGMSFEEAFPYIKPKELTDDERAYLYENTKKEDDSDILKYVDEIAKFMKDDGLNIYPYPEVELDWSEQNGLFITTGYYLPSEKKVVLFCKDRHPKDILRSYAHEMIHHMQNLEGKNLNFSNKDDVKDNEELEKLESEAYLKGNIYFRKWTEYEKNSHRNKLSLNERILSKEELWEITKQMDEGLSPDEVDLSSFNIKKNLNPKFWKNDLLDSRIRIKLLDIADDFIEFLGVDWVKPEDITITGSLANYNWNQKYSDIDLHILMDFSKVDERTDFVEEYFKSKKELWNEEHKDLKIFGFPIEVYVQDIKQEHISSGIYSLEKNEWLTEPEREKLSKTKVNKMKIKKIVSKYTEIIDNLEEEYKTQNNDKYKIERICLKADKLFDKIKKLRTSNLSDKKSEMSEGNIIFKCLRRLGYIEKLNNIIIDGYNKLNSLP
jgi:predicted transcriptional regulator